VYFFPFPDTLAKKGALTATPGCILTNKQVTERGQQRQPGVNLGQAAKSGFAVAEDLLDIPKRMLDVDTDTG